MVEELALSFAFHLCHGHEKEKHFAIIPVASEEASSQRLIVMRVFENDIDFPQCRDGPVNLLSVRRQRHVLKQSSPRPFDLAVPPAGTIYDRQHA